MGPRGRDTRAVHHKTRTDTNCSHKTNRSQKQTTQNLNKTQQRSTAKLYIQRAFTRVVIVFEIYHTYIEYDKCHMK